MEPLRTTHRVLIWLSVCSPDNSTSKTMRTAYAIFAFIVHFSNACNLTAGAVFSLKFMSIDLEQSLYASINVFGNIGIIYPCIYAAYFKRDEIRQIFEKLTTIYSKYLTTALIMIQN